MKINSSSPAQQAVLTDEQLNKLAERLAELLRPSTSSTARAPFETSILSKNSVTMDESTVDVGVSLEGIEASGPVVETTTTTADNTSSAKDKLKTLKKK